MLVNFFRKLFSFFAPKKSSLPAGLPKPLTTPSVPPKPEPRFEDFNLDERLLSGLKDMGFTKPTPIQALAVPHAMRGGDLIATAQTGTGKTAAFLLPMMNRLLSEPRTPGIKALILSPTRELTAQIEEQILGIGYHSGLTSVTVVGGVEMTYQERGLKGGVDIVAATPGRLLDHMRGGGVNFSGLKFLVLDEADRMYDMGFLPDLNRIISALPIERQTLLFSATMPDAIRELAKNATRSPHSIKIGQSNIAAVNVNQVALMVDEDKKVPLLFKMLWEKKLVTVLIFTNTKRLTQKLYEILKRKNISVDMLHGDMEQDHRTKALNRFKSGAARVLIATDVAARGIDVTGISHVINFEVPIAAEEYIHRIGRTGRAEFSGEAMTLVSSAEYRNWEKIARHVKSPIPLEPTSFFTGKMPEKNSSALPRKPLANGQQRHATPQARRPLGKKPRFQKA